MIAGHDPGIRRVLRKPSQSAPGAAPEEIAGGIARVQMRHPVFSPVNSWIIGARTAGRDALIVDTTYPDPESGAVWAEICDSGALDGVGTVLLTHHHRDHAGQALWLSERLGARLLASAGEAEALAERIAGAGAVFARELTVFYRRCGLSEAHSARLTAVAADYSDLRAPGARLEILQSGGLEVAGRDFEVIVSGGHSPAAVSLLDRRGGLFIAGDQLLPGGGPQITYFDLEDQTDHLGHYFDYLNLVSDLPDDILVLPGHGDAFYGAAARAAHIRAGHERRLARLLEVTDRAQSCAELIERMFPPQALAQFGWVLPGMLISLAGHLQAQGRLRRIEAENGLVLFERLNG